jgi:hypothetical protein
MAFNPSLYETLIAERHAQIRHDMQQCRKQTPIGQRQMLMHSAVSRFGTLLIELGSRLQRTALLSES